MCCCCLKNIISENLLRKAKKLNRWGTTVTMLFSYGLSRLIWIQNTLLTMDSPFSFCDWSITSFVFSSPIVLPSFAIASTVNSDDSSAFYCYIEQPFGIEVHIHKCISALHEIRYLCGAKDEVCNSASLVSPNGIVNIMGPMIHPAHWCRWFSPTQLLFSSPAPRCLNRKCICTHLCAHGRAGLKTRYAHAYCYI